MQECRNAGMPERPALPPASGLLPSALTGRFLQAWLVEVASEPRRSPEFLLRAGLDLPHAPARQAHPIADLLQRPRLVVFQAEAQSHDLALLAVQVAHRSRELVEI